MIQLRCNEEYCRAYLVVKLAEVLQYPPSCIELEKEYQAGKPKTIKPRIDILVKDKRKKEGTPGALAVVLVLGKWYNLLVTIDPDTTRRYNVGYFEIFV